MLNRVRLPLEILGDSSSGARGGGIQMVTSPSTVAGKFMRYHNEHLILRMGAQGTLFTSFAQPLNIVKC